MLSMMTVNGQEIPGARRRGVCEPRCIFLNRYLEAHRMNKCTSRYYY